eukprot:5475411-Prymnesium_polylepis.1
MSCLRRDDDVQSQSTSEAISLQDGLVCKFVKPWTSPYGAYGPESQPAELHPMLPCGATAVRVSKHPFLTPRPCIMRARSHPRRAHGHA